MAIALEKRTWIKRLSMSVMTKRDIGSPVLLQCGAWCSVKERIRLWWFSAGE
jgi:hypothetical protein